MVDIAGIFAPFVKVYNWLLVMGDCECMSSLVMINSQAPRMRGMRPVIKALFHLASLCAQNHNNIYILRSSSYKSPVNPLNPPVVIYAGCSDNQTLPIKGLLFVCLFSMLEIITRPLTSAM